MHSIHIEVSADVRAALDAHRPVVALESTIISHGMPFPENLEVALAVEQVIRENGAVPATIALLNGVPHVGMTRDQIEVLARAGRTVTKCSRRDLPYVIAKKLHGATTVSATMELAHMCGIEVFATGGIGGVHRGAETSWDISTDLKEFSRTPVMVVSAGAKAILDLPKTLEYLETEGVLVLGYRTSEFPAFYTPSSGLALSHRADTPDEIAAMHIASRSLGSPAGMLVANPIPAEHAMDKQVIDTAIARALADASAQGIVGKEVTPFLLARLCDITEKSSLTANIALVKNNARLGALVAVSLAAQRAAAAPAH
ncbi:putative Pseudouridine-5'-phosphate glycosidase [Paratrimastix pyriformis]|uniref:Pseudouridine-5'-phosphate glycosidase n=1 Tax=Paratrimastix pyriformis TaxID=342808 RepID=A0ABQ8UQF5_9EUKA|nr:putative Pseudouridine-5'-phosphate glycosidase [Paratrimastix pyriformis]|eukprot:GAFH01003315.1.p1 GENE.GAFH01003315.1~~GAFH01003315.1.p1  ORF type:complete len:314 (-),score=108.25 GAFH01003315.1:10-951(-)